MTLPSTRKLGFGLMRLPKNDDVIDIDQVSTMVDRFLEAGFNYFDAAWAYPGSEKAIRQTLVERYPRDDYLLATKNAAWLGCTTAADAMAQLDVSLERSRAGYFDFYLLHNLGESRTRVFDDFKLWDWALAQREAGRIRHLGFSFHAGAAELEEVLRAHPEAEFVQLQINYADWESPSIQSRRCLETARAHGKPVIVMEPVKGGLLAKPPSDVAAVLKAASPDSSSASWALRFAADQEGVYTVLSGMSNLAQMEDNLSTMAGFSGLTERERKILGQARKTLEAHPIVPCTSCGYCMEVCPEGIGIPGTFSALNLLTLFGDAKAAAKEESWSVSKRGHKRAFLCIGCGLCETACPQHIPIRKTLCRAVSAIDAKYKSTLVARL